MAGRRANSHTEAEWHALAREAILDLLQERFVVPWFEIESRISYQRYKSFPVIQPIQLHGARRALRDEDIIIEERTAHAFPVVTIRLPYPTGRQRELARLAGRRRRLFRRYLSWVGDQNLCGNHAERVVLASAQQAASTAGLWVPRQRTGAITELDGINIPGGFDAYAYILDLTTANRDAILVFEVKNINSWIYPSSPELWQLLVKAARLADSLRLLPVLACVRYAYPVLRMAEDLGFFITAFESQLFSLDVPEEDMSELIDDMSLAITRFEGPSPPVVRFLERTLRRNPSSPPPEDIEWYQRQIDRFQTVAPVITAHDILSRDTDGAVRARSLESFRAQIGRTAQWPLVKGW